MSEIDVIVSLCHTNDANRRYAIYTNKCSSIILVMRLVTLTVFSVLVTVRSNFLPGPFHKDVLLAKLGTAWFYDISSTVSLSYYLKVPTENSIVRSFCASKTQKDAAALSYPSSKPPFRRKREIIREGQRPPAAPSGFGRFLRHDVLGTLARQICSITNCVPSDNHRQLDSVYFNFTQVMEGANRLLQEADESHFYKELLLQGSLPLALRTNIALQQIVEERSFSLDYSIDPLVALNFATVRPVVCPDEQSVLLDIELVDFREATPGFVFQILHVGSFSHSRSSFARLSLPSKIFVHHDDPTHYSSFDLSKCLRSSSGEWICDRTAAATASDCDLRMLTGCASDVLVYESDQDGRLDVVAQLGDEYVVATKDRAVHNASTSSGTLNAIFVPPSGIVRLAIGEANELVVGARRLPGLAARVDVDYHEPEKFVWTRRGGIVNKSVDALGFGHYVDVADEAFHPMEPPGPLTLYALIVWQAMRDHFMIDFLMAQVDALFIVALFYVVDVICKAIIKANPFLNLLNAAWKPHFLKVSEIGPFV